MRRADLSFYEQLDMLGATSLCLSHFPITIIIIITIIVNQKQPICGHWNTPAQRHSLLVFHSLWSFSSEFQISAPKSDYNCCCRGKDRFVKSIISLKDKGKLSWCSARDIMDKTIEELQVLSCGAILVVP